MHSEGSGSGQRGVRCVPPGTKLLPATGGSLKHAQPSIPLKNKDQCGGWTSRNIYIYIINDYIYNYIIYTNFIQFRYWLILVEDIDPVTNEADVHSAGTNIPTDMVQGFLNKHMGQETRCGWQLLRSSIGLSCCSKRGI